MRLHKVVFIEVITQRQDHLQSRSSITESMMAFPNKQAFCPLLFWQVLLIIRLVSLKVNSEQWPIQRQFDIHVVSNEHVNVPLVLEHLIIRLWHHECLFASLLIRHLLVEILASHLLNLVSEFRVSLEHGLKLWLHQVIASHIVHREVHEIGVLLGV